MPDRRAVPAGRAGSAAADRSGHRLFGPRYDEGEAAGHQRLGLRHRSAASRRSSAAGIRAPTRSPGARSPSASRAPSARAPPRIASVSYDAVGVAIGLSTNPPGHRYTQANLTRANGFSGVDGIIRFSANGMSERGLGGARGAEVRLGSVIDAAPSELPGDESLRRRPDQLAAQDPLRRLRPPVPGAGVRRRALGLGEDRAQRRDVRRQRHGGAQILDELGQRVVGRIDLARGGGLQRLDALGRSTMAAVSTPDGAAPMIVDGHAHRLDRARRYRAARGPGRRPGPGSSIGCRPRPGCRRRRSVGAC